MSTTKVKAIELVFDWNLWPRHKAEVLDATNIIQIREALRAGITPPPVIADSKSLRLIDGFHRTRAYLDVFGEEAEIDVELREYKDDAAMLLEAGALNNHGLKLSPQDRAYFIHKCRKMKVPPAAIATALGMDPAKMSKFFAKRSAKSQSGETVILPGGARNLAGKVLTPEQEHYARHTCGVVPEMYANMLYNALVADVLIPDEKTIRVLQRLYDKIGEVLEDAVNE